MRPRLLLPLVLAAYWSAAAGQLYSWKDASGKVHYSDEPPAEKAPVRKVAPPATRAADPDVLRNAAEQEAASRKKQKEAQEAAGKADKDKADADERRVECERAQGNLRALESGQIRFTVNAKGERVALEGGQREAELAKARKAADGWCK